MDLFGLATAEVAAPHRLGAALTYARRYALFALVGITGEDDLDAPDLPVRPEPATAASEGIGLSGRPVVRRPKLHPVPQSEEIRRKLLDELEGIDRADDLTLWALRRLPRKNRLQDDDAGLVETGYLNRLEILEAGQGVAATSNGEATGYAGVQATSAPSPNDTVVTLPKTVRKRDKGHLVFVASQSCLVCRRTPSDAHHLKFSQPRALGRKVSDEFTVPLCRDHHNELHRIGNERSFWANVGVEPTPIAQALWRASQAGDIATNILHREVSAPSRDR